MRTSKLYVGLTAVLFLAACGRTPAVALTPSADVASARWNAVIGTPESLQGVVQTRGSASLSSVDDGRKTRVTVNIENAVPRGRHPLIIRTGQCGGMGSEVASVADGRSLTVDDDGKARSEFTLDLSFPTSGDYMIGILASSDNLERVLACGNFASPVNR